MSIQVAKSDGYKEAPWYKHFWVWVVIGLPLSAVIASIATVVIAFKHQDTLVSEDYYKDGLAVNLNLQKQRMATQLALKASLQVIGDEVVVRLDDKRSVPDSALTLVFLHPTLEQHDQHLLLQRDAQGQYRGTLAYALMDGKWIVQLGDVQQYWLMKKIVYAPLTSAVSIDATL